MLAHSAAEPSTQPSGEPAAVAGAGAVSLAGLLVLPLADFGPLSLGMVGHLAVMNVLAPLVAVALARSRRLPGLQGQGLWLAAAAQLLLLWAWHGPTVQQGVARTPALQAILLAPLAISAVAFWLLILREAAQGRWTSIFALLFTGKLACLLGALLIFAPRDVYALPEALVLLCAAGPSSLADQQFAGLLMVTACPLSYITAAVCIAARLLLPPRSAVHGEGSPPLVAR